MEFAKVVEKQVIGAALEFYEPWHDGVDLRHFSDKTLAQIYGIMLHLVERGSVVDLATVAAEAQFRGVDLVTSDLVELSCCVTTPRTTVSAKAASAALLRDYNRRMANDMAKKIIECDNYPMRLRLMGLMRNHAEACNATAGADDYAVTDVAGDYLRWESEVEVQGRMALGIPRIDTLMSGGIRPGQYCVLGARPGVGKSTIGIQIAKRISQNKKVVYASFEMSRFSLLKNMIGKDKRGLQDFRDGKYDLSFIEEGRKIEELEDRIRRIMRKDKKDLIIVDHFHLLTAGGNSLYMDRTSISKALQAICYDNQVAMLVLCQLNRNSKNEKRPPGLQDFRDSGSIEEEADYAMFLHRDDQNPNTKIILAKNRETGQLGHAELFYDQDSRELKEVGFNYES